MAGLDGTIKTPMGPIQKKTAVIVGGGVVVVAAIVWYRQRGSQSDSGALVDPDAPINPATGYPYGSAEDAAALAAQSAYVSPPANPGGGSGAIPPNNLSYSTNGQWTQSVIQYMMENDLVQDSSQLATALGKYITGAYCNDTDVSLIQQAVAVQGYPPLAGPSGYPPSINRTPPIPVVVPPPATNVPNPNPRGYGWYRVVKGDNIDKVAAKYGITKAQFITWNSGDALRVGEWVKVRGGSNPTVGYNGVK